MMVENRDDPHITHTSRRGGADLCHVQAALEEALFAILLVQRIVGPSELLEDMQYSNVVLSCLLWFILFDYTHGSCGSLCNLSFCFFHETTTITSNDDALFMQQL